MATVTANKMSTLVKKGKLSGLQVARLIHQYYADGFNGSEPTGLTEVELKMLASNLDHGEWRKVSHWVDDGIDLLCAFAMNIQSEAALIAAELHQVNMYLTMVIHFDKTDRLSKKSETWAAKTLSIRSNIHRVLWNHEALRVVGDYINTDWSLISSRGMTAMQGAVEQINETIARTAKDNFSSFEMDELRPAEEVIKDWKQKVEMLNIRDFLLAVTESENEA